MSRWGFDGVFFGSCNSEYFCKRVLYFHTKLMGPVSCQDLMFFMPSINLLEQGWTMASARLTEKLWLIRLLYVYPLWEYSCISAICDASCHIQYISYCVTMYMSEDIRCYIMDVFLKVVSKTASDPVSWVMWYKSFFYNQNGRGGFLHITYYLSQYEMGDIFFSFDNTS